MAFDRSSFTKEMHTLARNRQSYFAQKYPQREQPAYSEFLKNDNPTDATIMVYEVSYQLSYESAKDGLKMKNPQTFTIYAIEGMETADSIYEKTKAMVLDMKGELTGDTMQIGTRTYFDENDSYLNIDVSPRGLEKVEKRKVLPAQYQELLKGGFAVEQLDDRVSITNKKNYTSKMKLDIRHFM